MKINATSYVCVYIHWRYCHLAHAKNNKGWSRINAGLVYTPGLGYSQINRDQDFYLSKYGNPPSPPAPAPFHATILHTRINIKRKANLTVTGLSTGVNTPPLPNSQ